MERERRKECEDRCVVGVLWEVRPMQHVWELVQGKPEPVLTLSFIKMEKQWRRLLPGLTGLLAVKIKETNRIKYEKTTLSQWHRLYPQALPKPSATFCWPDNHIIISIHLPAEFTIKVITNFILLSVCCIWVYHLHLLQCKLASHRPSGHARWGGHVFWRGENWCDPCFFDLLVYTPHPCTWKRGCLFSFLCCH